MMFMMCFNNPSRRASTVCCSADVMKWLQMLAAEHVTQNAWHVPRYTSILSHFQSFVLHFVDLPFAPLDPTFDMVTTVPLYW